MDDIKKIVSRVKKLENFKTDKELAEFFGLLPQDLNKRKKSGTIHRLILEYAINKKVDLNWLYFGETAESRDCESVIITSGPVKDDRGRYRSECGDERVGELLGKAREVLNSGGHFGASLSANIESFHKALKTERSLEDRLALVEKGMKRAIEQVRKDDPPEKKQEIIKQRAISSG